jgi:hypothetical protein
VFDILLGENIGCANNRRSMPHGPLYSEQSRAIRGGGDFGAVIGVRDRLRPTKRLPARLVPLPFFEAAAVLHDGPVRIGITICMHMDV